MEEKVEKLFKLVGNENRYQYFVMSLTIWYWISCNLLSTTLAYLENTPLISYYDKDSQKTIVESLDYTSCKWDKSNYTIVETYSYSWVIEQEIECSKFKTGLIGMIAFAGNTLGALIFPLISGFGGQKAPLFTGTLMWVIFMVICIFIKHYEFYIIVCIICNTASNFMCYGSLTIAGEICSIRLRSIFGSMCNFGYALGGIVYIILFMVLQKWTLVFIINASALGFAGLIAFFFLVESPRYLLHKDIDKFIKCLKTIAFYNGRSELFEKSINESEYVEILDYLREHLKKESGEKNNIENVISNTKGVNINKKENLNDKGDLIPPDSPAGIGNIEVIEVEEKRRRKSTNADEGEGIKIESDASGNAMKNEKELSAINTISKYNNNMDTIQNLSNEKNNLSSSSKNSLNESIKEKKKKISPLALIKYPSIRYKFILMCFEWFIVAGIYNGLQIGIKLIPGDIYVNGILLFAVMIASYIVCIILMEIHFFGRRNTTILCLLCTVISLILLIIFLDNDKCAVIFYIMTSFWITMPDNIFYTYCLEIYPTPIRASGFGINATCNNIGSIIVPMLMELFSDKVIYGLFCVLSGIAGILMFFLEETVGKHMPETIKEIEEEKKIQNEMKDLPPSEIRKNII